MAFDGPRLRRDLVATILQEDGVRCVDVYDPDRDSSFRLFDYEYSVALAFDGRPLAKIIPWVRLSTGLDLTPEQLTAFAERLDQLGFLTSDEDGTPEITVEIAPAPVPLPVAVASPTPAPVPSETVQTPVPVPAPTVTAASDTPAPAPAPPEALAPPESRPVTPEPTPPAAETATTETPLSDATTAPEPPAAVVTPPDAQAELLSPTADAPPTPVATPPAANAPAPEPVPTGAQPAAVLDETPAPSPAPARTPTPLPVPRRIVTPPPIPAPPALVTPPPSAVVRGGPWILYALFGTLAAVAVGVLLVPLALTPHPPAAARARVLVARPRAVLRWFDGTAPIEAPPSQVLSFPAGGKVIKLASPGTLLGPGDVAAATDAARSLLADLTRQQKWLADFEQVVQDVRDTGDEARMGAAQAKVELGAGLVEQTQRALSRVAVVAQSPNLVEATLATLGQKVQPGALAVRVRRPGWRANFELPRALATRFRKQGFCVAEIEGRPVGCELVPDGGDEDHVVVELLPGSATAAGQPLRLARARLADAFLVPASALSRVGKSDRVLLVAPSGRAEGRNVTVADRTATDAVITQGLDAGDAVIIETSEPVGVGARVRIAEAMRE
jgi:hypothetical protein